MKYLRKYNEGYDKVYDELTEELVKDFCEESLVYLTDNGMKIIVDRYYATKGEKRFSISLSSDNHVMKWVEIKDYIIPFLIRLNDKFTMIDCFPGQNQENYTIEIDMYPNSATEGGTYSDYFTKEDIVDEKVTDRLRNNIKYITFYIRKKGV